MEKPKDETANEPTNPQRALRIANCLPAYFFYRRRPSSFTTPEAAQCDEDDLRDLICDALHFARSRGFEPGEIMADAALNFSAEEEGAPDAERGEQAAPPCVVRVVREPMLCVSYNCPDCGNEWDEFWESACDSECPACGTENIQADSWERLDGKDEADPTGTGASIDRAFNMPGETGEFATGEGES